MELTGRRKEVCHRRFLDVVKEKNKRKSVKVIKINILN